MLNLPNILTIFRIILVPAMMVSLYTNKMYSNQIALMFFTIASITDFFDGYIARKYKLVTVLGKILDPVADKILVTAAMIVLVEQGRLASWIVILMLLRDFSVGALRDVAAQKGFIIAAGIWGKIKTVLQILALGFLIFKDTLILWPLNAFFNITTEKLQAGYIGIPAGIIGYVLIYLALGASLYSGFVYFKNFNRFFKDN